MARQHYWTDNNWVNNHTKYEINKGAFIPFVSGKIASEYKYFSPNWFTL